MVIDMNSVKRIKDYILFLKQTCGLSVSLHVDGIDKLIIPSELSLFNIHDNSYCTLIKKNTAAYAHCVRKQKDIFKKCGEGEFCGACYAGVTEFVYPVKNNGRTVAFISVGGYKTEEYMDCISEVAEQYAIPKDELLEAYSMLKAEIHSREYIDTLIFPLKSMLELMYIKIDEEDNTDTNFCAALVNYIKKNYTRDISSKDICNHFYCSRSKVSHSFNRGMGMSISNYINILRCDGAKELLKTSELSVTEIAFSVGFKDSNYFTGVFKKTVGMTPSVFRKKYKLK